MTCKLVFHVCLSNKNALAPTVDDGRPPGSVLRLMLENTFTHGRITNKERKGGEKGRGIRGSKTPNRNQ